MASTAKVGTEFRIYHHIQDGKNSVSFCPTKKTEGYPDKSIILTEEQWNELKFHFATQVNDKAAITRLAYVY